MPTITFEDHQISVAPDANLRKALFKSKATPHNAGARFLNCKGLGTCGTCAVEITGDVSSKTAVEKWRLGFPPHRPGANLRLACQVKVKGDIQVKKHPGFWGQEVDQP